MEASIEGIVHQLQRLSSSKLQLVADFVAFLNWQQCHAQATADRLEVFISNSAVDNSAFEEILSQLADQVFTARGENTAPLPDFAVSRSGIYGDHP
ncbi:MAG: hypothetical protein HC929_14170 [Leptolyngbyaceae cyanobacterium SM2_5_2]|nr:hypothetical protein [Leptolyngbyaceae cyanobacterium SM2_5_2]